MLPRLSKLFATGLNDLIHISQYLLTEATERRKELAAAKLFLPLFLALCFTVIPARAASPSGTVSPVPGDYVHWYGKQTPAASSIDESTCVEGVNCETFTLTVSGTPLEWVGKHARVSVFWGSRTSDYDLYIHKGSNTGPLVAYSAHGATDSDNFEEVINLDPATSGTGEYSIHVVYFATTGDLYIGDVTVTINDPEPTPTPTPTPTPEPTPTPPPGPTPEPVENNPAGPSCTLPGVKTSDDETGDAADGLGAHDLESIWVAEPGNLINKLVFTIKVADLSSVPPNSEWRAEFSGFFGDSYWVSMNTVDPLRGVRFYYGHYTYVAGERKSFTDGEADAGEYFPDGTIRITISNNKVGNFSAGQRMFGPMVTIRAFEGLPFTGLTGVMDTNLRSNGYLVVGNLSCDYLPTVAITSPADGATFAPGDITISAEATDADGTISRVEFFQGDTKIGESAASPYSFNWSNVPEGSYTLTARATDNVGGSTTSAPVHITVQIPPPAAPTNLTATVIKHVGIDKSLVTLLWSDQSDNEQLFHVERSTSATGGFVELATVGANVTTFADSNAQRKTTYYYRVRASNSTGYSAYSNTASANVK